MLLYQNRIKYAFDLIKIYILKKFSKDVRENNPLFLKDKGDDFFKNKDYYSAINAYGQAFKRNE